MEKLDISIKDASEIVRTIQTEIHWINSVFNRAGMSPPTRFRELLKREQVQLEAELANLNNHIKLYYEDKMVVPVSKERVEAYERKNNKN